MNRSIALFSALLAAAQGVSSAPCYALPGDTSWPSEYTWSKLNSTVDGRLVATEPIGSPCHDPTYDADACTALQSGWVNPLTHIPSSSSVMQAYFANQSCDPFTDRTIPCTLGNYVSYAVNVSNTADVQAALKFSQTNNIRVVVRNTGHDFLGRSTGAGALAIWTNHLKEISFLDWSDDGSYVGPAARVGAGVLGYEIIEAAQAAGFAVVSGECATVGLAGGFTQGGGHSALSTAFGLAADQVLEYEVVTADGQAITASPTENSDLYWALSGGGGGTFGVVTSLTVRAHKAATVGGGAMQLIAPTTTPEKFAAAVTKFHELLPAMIDKGAMVVFLLSSQYLVLRTVTVWNSTATYVRDAVLAPFAAALEEIGITQQFTYSELSYRDHYNAYFGPLPRGNLDVAKYSFGGRLIPRSVLETNNEGFSAVVSNLTANGVLFAGSAANYAKPAGTPDNAVIPAWRNTAIQMQLIVDWNVTAPWAENIERQRKMTAEFVPQIEAVTPGSNAYMNEADFHQPNWQTTFFGSNYAKLLEIKQKYDPRSVFYTLKGVGSEAWTIGADGRMCKA